MLKNQGTYALLLSGLFISNPADAYLDPGTGSILLQGLIALLAGVGVTARMYWGRIASAFGFRKQSGVSDLAVDSDAADRKEREAS